VVSNTFGAGTGAIMMDDVGCTGSENTLVDCFHLGFLVHNCDHDEDVAIECSIPATTANGMNIVQILQLDVSCSF